MPKVFILFYFVLLFKYCFINVFLCCMACMNQKEKKSPTIQGYVRSKKMTSLIISSLSVGEFWVFVFSLF